MKKHKAGHRLKLQPTNHQAQFGIRILEFLWTVGCRTLAAFARFSSMFLIAKTARAPYNVCILFPLFGDQTFGSP